MYGFRWCPGGILFFTLISICAWINSAAKMAYTALHLITLAGSHTDKMAAVRKALPPAVGRNYRDDIS